MYMYVCGDVCVCVGGGGGLLLLRCAKVVNLAKFNVPILCCSHFAWYQLVLT